MIIFHSLTRENIHKIIDLELTKLFARIQDLGYNATMTEKAKDFIVDKGYDEKFGARPLKRAIQKYIEDPLAEEIIKANLKEGDTIVLDIEEGAALLTLTIAQPAKKTTKK
jgi:ATP-dependent Clp protease ATP-binding subunit ClpC